MSSSPVDANMALDAVARNELVQRKMDMDALKKRIEGGKDEKEKLRDACEGFEAIFVQKMWEQMRKTVPKGYLHSKDQETYQSMFDVELSKKMASAGGIGLADMLYQQLSAQLENTGRTTSPGGYRTPVKLESVHGRAPENTPPVQSAGLYSELEAPEMEEDEPEVDSIAVALREIRNELADRDEAAEIFNGSNWDKMEYVARTLGRDVERQGAEEAVKSEEAASDGPAGEAVKETAKETEKEDRTIFSGSSWHAPNTVSVEPRPMPRHRQVSKTGGAASRAGRPDQSVSSMAPAGAASWPLNGRVASGFGWEEDPASGRRRWNSGVTIEAAPGDPVRACMDGEVVFAGERENGGHTVILQHADGYRSFYGNVQAKNIHLGDRVQSGAVFAEVAVQAPASVEGEKSSPAFLSFELKRGEMALNPEAALKGALEPGNRDSQG